MPSPRWGVPRKQADSGDRNDGDACYPPLDDSKRITDFRALEGI
jgi:hypothetical protein